MTFTPRAWKNRADGGTDTLDADTLIDLEQRVYDGAVADAKSPVSGYRYQGQDKTDPTYVYVGYEHPDGPWIIKRRHVPTGVWTRAAGTSSYPTNWTNRGSQTYA